MGVPLEAFRTEEPVYIDYPFEDVKFRWQDRRVYKQFNGKQEIEVPYSDNLFREAIRSGDVITQQQYELAGKATTQPPNGIK